jgi:hypothetical protein
MRRGVWLVSWLRIAIAGSLIWLSISVVMGFSQIRPTSYLDEILFFVGGQQFTVRDAIGFGGPLII